MMTSMWDLFLPTVETSVDFRRPDYLAVRPAAAGNHPCPGYLTGGPMARRGKGAREAGGPRATSATGWFENTHIPRCEGCRVCLLRLSPVV